MATLTGKITDVTSKAPENITSITVKAPSVRIGSGTGIIVTSPAEVTFDKTTGDITLSGLHVGLSWLYIEGDGWSDSIPLAVAEGFQLILEAVANASGVPGIADYVLMIRNSGEHARELARAAVDGEIGEVVRLAQSAATTAEQAATTATRAATSAEVKAGNAVSRVEALEALGGLSPEAPADGQTANLIAQQDTLTRQALDDAYTPRGVAIYDTFTDVPEGETPRETDSGHTWRYPYDDGRVVVSGGRMTALSAGEYPEVSASAPISRMGARFVINDDAGAKTTSGTLSLNAWGDGGVAANGVGRSSQAHIGFSDTNVRASVRDSENGTLTQIYWQFYEKLQPGVEYECGWWIFDDMTVVRCPDGSVVNFRHPAVKAVKGTFANWQIFVPSSTSSVFELLEVWADTTPVSGAVSADGAVATALSQPTTVLEDSPVRALTKDGKAGEIITLSDRGQVAVSRGRSDDPAVQLGGEIDLVAGGSPVLRVKETGAELLGSQIHLNTSVSGPSIQEGNVHPEGVVTARLGSLYLYRGAFNTIGGSLFVRTTGPAQANTGWVPAVIPQAPLAGGNFASAGSAINQRGKYHGKQAMTTTNLLLVAHGAAPTDPWGDGQGNVVYTPA